jgi:hypothetical protein
MEYFVRNPIRTADRFGKVLALIFLVAIVFDAPAWVLFLLLVGGFALYGHLSARADERASELS